MCIFMNNYFIFCSTLFKQIQNNFPKVMVISNDFTTFAKN
jgi:hypothetical protein